MTWIKVCGVRTATDIEVAAEVGADAIGLVLTESPRQIEPRQASQLVQVARRSGLESILVVKDTPAEQVMSWVSLIKPSGIQPHGSEQSETAEQAHKGGFRVLFPIPVSGPVDLEEIPQDYVPLLDTYHPQLGGGTGERFDPKFAPSSSRAWVLAGGLTPNNVAEAIAQTRPWGVDASSGLESVSGQKDHQKIREFVQAAQLGSASPQHHPTHPLHSLVSSS